MEMDVQRCENSMRLKKIQISFDYEGILLSTYPFWLTRSQSP